MIIALAPMDGITNCAYRTVAKELFMKNNTNPDAQLRLWTEFMNVEWFMREPWRLIHHMIKTDFEDTTIAQIYGADHHDLVATAQYIDTHMSDFAGIELNIWCPSPKVMSCGGGAGMMKDRPRTMAIIREISSTCKLPFSIKTRAGLTQEDKEAQHGFILEAAQYCRHIIIHGRTYKQSHTGDVDRDFIYAIKRELGDRCIVLGNGGIASHEQMLSRMHSGDINGTILDGTMVGQAAIGRPRLLTGTEPSLADRLSLIERHARMSIVLHDYYEKNMERGRDRIQPTYARLCNAIEHFDPSHYQHDRTMMEFRKYLFSYVSGLAGSRELKTQLAQTKDYTTTMQIVTEFLTSSNLA